MPRTSYRAIAYRSSRHPDRAEEYALLAGRNRGQTIYGGQASGEDLVLLSTRSATKGQCKIGEVGNILVGDTSTKYAIMPRAAGKMDLGSATYPFGTLYTQDASFSKEVVGTRFPLVFNNVAALTADGYLGLGGNQHSSTKGYYLPVASSALLIAVNFEVTVYTSGSTVTWRLRANGADVLTYMGTTGAAGVYNMYTVAARGDCPISAGAKLAVYCDFGTLSGTIANVTAFAELAWTV